MPLVIEQDGGNALAVFTHPHHEDLVDNHDDGLPFFRGMQVEGTNLETVSVGPNLQDNFNYRLQFAKHFVAGRVIAQEAYNSAMAYASSGTVSRDQWYFARRFGRIQERRFVQKTTAALRELTVMLRIMELIATFHQHDKPDIEVLNLGTVLAAICFATGLVVPDGVLSAILIAAAVGHMFATFFPAMAHKFLAFMVEKMKMEVVKVYGAVKYGDATEADFDPLDSWKFRFLVFIVPDDIGFANINI